jgi:hypothetical protein
MSPTTEAYAPTKKFRKKPVVIDAAQFFPYQTPWPEGVQADAKSPTGYSMFTLEATAHAHEVTPGDWIITGVAGEKYACKESIFTATYDAVGEGK